MLKCRHPHSLAQSSYVMSLAQTSLHCLKFSGRCEDEFTLQGNGEDLKQIARDLFFYSIAEHKL
jgi:hypothetical protein